MPDGQMSYSLDDVTPDAAKAAKKLLDNSDFRMLCNVKLQSLGQDVLNALPGDEVSEAHREYWALRSFLEWVERAASYGD